VLQVRLLLGHIRVDGHCNFLIRHIPILDRIDACLNGNRVELIKQLGQRFYRFSAPVASPASGAFLKKPLI
jgi:hypothetical protein